MNHWWNIHKASRQQIQRAVGWKVDRWNRSTRGYDFFASVRSIGWYSLVAHWSKVHNKKTKKNTERSLWNEESQLFSLWLTGTFETTCTRICITCFRRHASPCRNASGSDNVRRIPKKQRYRVSSLPLHASCLMPPRALAMYQLQCANTNTYILPKENFWVYLCACVCLCVRSKMLEDYRFLDRD